MLNSFLLTALIPLLFVIPPKEDVSTTPTSPQAEVSVAWLCGNWQVKSMQHNDEKLFCRDAFRFFDDKTGFQGRKSRFEWQTTGKYLIFTTYKMGIREQINWTVKRSKKNTLIMERVLTSNGNKPAKLVQVELERKLD